MEYIKKLCQKTGWISIIESVIFAILALILIWYPVTTLRIISCILGIVFIVIGISKVANYFMSKGNSDFYNYDLIFGLMAAVLGIITIVCSDTISAIFRIVIGVWIVYSALIRINISIKLKSMKMEAWIPSLVLAIIMLICGIYVALNSGSVVATIGIIMLVYSIIDIIENVIFMKNVKDVL